MLSALARAIETFFGPLLQPAASFFRIAATVGLIVALAAAGWSITRALTAWRFGWTTVPAVRCPRCGRLALDPEEPACPEGHPVRFPPWNRPGARSGVRRSAAPWSSVVYPVLLAAALALLVVLGYRAAGIDRLTRPLSSISAAAAYFFLLASLFSAGVVLSPGRRGPGMRAAHVLLLLACLLPASTLLLFARALEPPREREIGSLWITPTALYAAPAGKRGRRVGPAVARVDALLVEARAPAFGVVWQGLKGFRVEGRDAAWRGEGGLLARILDRWATTLEHRGVLLARSEQQIPLTANRRVGIVTSGERVRFPAPE